jgi:hypothetical protein
VGTRLRGVSLFPMAGDLEGNAPIGSSLLYGHFPKCLRYSVSIAEKVSDPLGPAQMVSKSFKVHFTKCLGIDLGIYFTFPSKQRVSFY